MCGVSLLQDAASELIYPLLPLLLTVTLAAPAAVVGIIEGVAEGAAALTKLLAGRAADRQPRRRPLVSAGYAMAAVGKVIVAAATVWPVALVGRVVDRVGKGIRGAPRDSLLVEGVAVDRRGAAFGLHRAADTVGAILGPLAGIGLYALVGLRGALWIAVVPATLSALLTVAVRDKPRQQVPESPTEGPGRAPPTAHPRFRPGPELRHVLVLLTAFALVNLPDALLLLRASDIGFGASGLLALYVAYNCSYAALSFPFGALSDRVPKRLVVAGGLGVFAGIYVALGLSTDRTVAVALFLLYGAYAAATDGVGKAWVSSLSPAGSQGSAQGLFQGLSGVGVLVAGIWGGLTWGSAGEVPLVVAGSAAGLLAVLVAVGLEGR